mmetsp:Transcript_12779/g.28356  ORF Transcript_12779/g.28356 Transcript_12779/m.28356 type:complete len:345 (-) Transcript_12779:3794-4828(-)
MLGPILHRRRLSGCNLSLADIREIHGQHTPKMLHASLKVRHNLLRHGRACVLDMTFQHGSDLVSLKGNCIRQLLVAPAECHHLLVTSLLEVPSGIEHPCDAPTHSSAKVGTAAPEHQHATTGHVLASVVTNALNNSPSTGVADSESLSRNATEKGQTKGGTIQADVANDDVVFGVERRILRGVYDQGTSGQALACVVIRVSFQLEHHTLGQEGAQRVTCGPSQLHVHQTGRQRVSAPPLCQLRGQQRADSSVTIPDIRIVHNARIPKSESQIGSGHQVTINEPLKHREMFLGVQFAILHLANLARIGHAMSRHQDGQHLQSRRPLELQILIVLQCFRMADHLIH